MHNDKHMHTCEQFLNLQVNLGLDFVWACLIRFIFLCVSLNHLWCCFIVVLGSFSSVPRIKVWLDRTSSNDLYFLKL